MTVTSVRLPEGKYYALTWSIPDNYGGMTSALLHRSRAFRQIAGVDVEVLTVDDRPNYDELTQQLLDSGELIDGVRLRNMWQELRGRTLAPGAQTSLAQHAAAPLSAAASDRVIEHEGTVVLREGFDEAGASTGIDRFRQDGSLLATERNGLGKRSIVLYAPDGTPSKRFTSRWKLYRWWLDSVFKKRLSFVIIDSKTSARFMPDYRRENVVTLHLVHASHRDRQNEPSLRASREDVLRRTRDFDSTIVLTERQRSELRGDLAALGVSDIGRIEVIPNGTELTPAVSAHHVRGRGIMLASLDARKRIEHAVTAVAKAHESSSAVCLDVYGRGDREAKLRQQIDRLSAQGYISLRGYDTDARLRFREADFSLLTSTSEGLPLVLAESMAAGCIPIAYDVRYGPGDIIRDGVDGFLLEEGDTDGVARRIVELQQMTDAEIEAMRSRAIERSQEFSDAAVVKKWGREFERALTVKRLRESEGRSIGVKVSRRAGLLRRRVGALRRKVRAYLKRN